jgi:hypothetical protein
MEFVGLAYGLTYLVLASYATYLLRRRQRAARRLDESVSDRGGAR